MSKPNSRMLALFALLLIAFGANSLYATAWPSAFSNVTNFHNAQNFTNFANGTFYGRTIGKTNYAYLTINNLASVTSSGWLFRGYTGNVFIGNVSAYPYQSGFLVSLHTIKGSAYNTLVMFSNQSVIQNTSSMVDQHVNINVDRKAIKYSIYEYLLGINVTPGGDYQVAFGGCSYANNQTCSWSFSPKQPYFFIQTASYPNQNVSVDYINGGGIQEAMLSENSISVSIKGKGLLGGILTQTMTTPFMVLVNGSISNPADAFRFGANQTFLASNGIGWKTNRTISGLYNSTSTANVGWAYTGTNNKATITVHTDSAPYENTAFYLVPAYTTQYTNTTTFYNATPKSPSLNSTLCFKWQVPITNITWTNNFTTYAYPGHLGTAYNVTSPADYLELTFPHKSEMGDGCNYIYLTDAQFGQPIPYKRISCTNGTTGQVTLIADNRTLNGMQFSSLVVSYGTYSKSYFDFSNTMVGQEWHFIANANVMTITASKDYLITLTEPLFMSPASTITFENYFANIVFGTYFNGSYKEHLWAPTYSGAGNFTDHTDARNIEYLVTPNEFTSGTVGNVIYTTSFSYSESQMSNTTASSGYLGNLCYGEPCDISLNLHYPLAFNATYLTSTTYTYPKLFAATPFPLNSLACNGAPKPITPPYNNQTTMPLNTSTNGTVIAPGNTLTNSSLWGNVSDYRSRLSGTVTFYDLIIPVPIAIILAVLEVVCIALAFASDNEWVVLFTLVAANFIGLTLLLGVAGIGAGFLLVSMLAAGYYVIRNAHKWWH